MATNGSRRREAEGAEAVAEEEEGEDVTGVAVVGEEDDKKLSCKRSERRIKFGAVTQCVAEQGFDIHHPSGSGTPSFVTPIKDGSVSVSLPSHDKRLNCSDQWQGFA